MPGNSLRTKEEILIAATAVVFGGGVLIWSLHTLKNQMNHLRICLRDWLDGYLDSLNSNAEVQVITEYLRIREEAAPLILKNSNAVLRKIERETKVFLRVVPAVHSKESLKRKLDISKQNPLFPSSCFIKMQSCSGERIALARAALKSELSQLDEEISEVSLDVPNEVMGHIIGGKGRNVTKISEMYEVNIQIKREDEHRHVITLQGRKGRVIMAKDAICRSIRRQGDQRGEDELKQAFEELMHTESLTGDLNMDEYW